MDVYEIKKIVIKCCSSLAGSHDQSWPLVPDKGGSSLAGPYNQSWPGCPEKVDRAEKNTTLRLVCQLLEAGFGVYAKQSFKMKEEPKPFEMEGEPKLVDVDLDLLALNYEKKTQVRVQIKRDSYNTSTTIDDIHQDLKKIKSFKMTGRDSDYKNKFGIIININWESTFINWWKNPGAEPIENPSAFTKKKEKIIGLLIDRSKKKKSDCVSGTFKMGKVNEEDGEYGPIYGIQYLIFDLNNNEIKKLLP